MLPVERTDHVDQAEIDARDLAIIEALRGDISDVPPLFDAEEWIAAAAEWRGIEL